MSAVTVELTDLEAVLAETLAEILGVDEVRSDAHVFDDLGADSMVMARFCAKIRKRDDLPSPSMKQVYAHPTVAGLAAALAEESPRQVVSTSLDHRGGVVSTSLDHRGAAYVACGAAQVTAFVAYAWLAAVALGASSRWIAAGTGAVDTYARAVIAGAGFFVAAAALPVLVKWLLVGRWKSGEMAIWGPAYLRFWIVKTLLRTSPALLFVGSPLYVLYLRALGARIGPGAVIFTRHVPVCTDLLTVGAGAVIRKDSFVNCYQAGSGVLRIGPVSIGRDAVIGEETVLEIDTAVGDGAQLAHSSSLSSGQRIPDGERRAGARAEDATALDLAAARHDGGATRRRAVYAAYQLIVALALLAPALIGGVTIVIEALPGAESVRDVLLLVSAAFVAVPVVGLAVVTTVPRLLNLAITPDRAYPLYGLHYGIHRAIARLTNVKYFVHLFGDSSYVVPYLRAIGYDLSRVRQTGSNFGLEVKHETPFHLTIGRGTMVADGLSVINADFSSTAFRVSHVRIGAHSFLGNYVAYPSQARTGHDVLLATKVGVPVDGSAVAGIGVLGSPAFEIPRSVARDGRYDAAITPALLRRRLRAKNRHNAVTIGIFLLSRWALLLGFTVLGIGAARLSDVLGAFAFALAALAAVVLGIAFTGLVERASTGFRPLAPRSCSIYDPYFWWHERFWKLAIQPRVLDGTPFKGLAWRLLGVDIGKRVYDDGCAIVEKTLTRIGDDCALNAMSVIQPHSQEDGAFKSDRVVLGRGCSVGTRSLVHYGATMGDGAVLGSDAFLMKGEDVPAGARWSMNPARETP